MAKSKPSHAGNQQDCVFHVSLILFSFSPPRSSSMPSHSAVCQEDVENGSHDKGIGMEVDEVNSSFSRLSLSPSFD